MAQSGTFRAVERTRPLKTRGNRYFCIQRETNRCQPAMRQQRRLWQSFLENKKEPQYLVLIALLATLHVVLAC